MLGQLLQMITMQMQQQQAQQAQAQDMLRHMANAQNAGLPGVGSSGTATAHKAMDERHFRRIKKVFDNKSDTWKECRTHFLTAVRESSPITAEVLEKAESSDVPVVADDVLKTSQTYQEALGLQYILHARLVSTTTGVSFTMADSAEGNGIEAWRLLSQNYNPSTHSRCLQLVRSISNFRVPQMDDVLIGLARWEVLVALLACDHKEVLSEKLRTALMISILPQTLQE